MQGERLLKFSQTMMEMLLRFSGRKDISINLLSPTQCNLL